MYLRPWLAGLGNRVRSRRKNARKNIQAHGENLEPRTLLTVTALLVAPTELIVVSDRDDAITVQADLNGDVQVLDDGIALNIGSIPANTLTKLEIVGGDGDNTLDVSGIFAGQFMALAEIEIDGGDGNDNIIGSNDFGELIDGDDGNDTIDGAGGDDTIDGDDGVDMITGGTGNDVIDGGDGADQITGGLGLDTIDGGNGDDVIDGGFEDDSIDGSQGDDCIMGGDGNDSIIGGSGNDVVSGGIGLDTILGGANDDIIDGDDGNDSIFGQGGVDQLNGNIGNDFIDGGNGNDSIDGGNGDDMILAGLGKDSAQGGAGDDNIIGGGGNDSLNGDQFGLFTNAGNDTLLGNSGADTLIGGGGADYMRGNRGNDLIMSGDLDTDANLILTIDNQAVNEGDTGTTTVTFTASIQRVDALDVTATFTTMDGLATVADNDYIFSTGPLTIPAGSTSATITVDVVGDGRPEGTEDFFVELTNAANALIGTPRGQVLIQDDDVWSPAGPGPSTNGQVENVTPNNEVVGAIHSVVAHPTNADILYAGGANGGIWRTLNATAQSPNWEPLTDELGSLSIGSLEMDPSDPNSLLAGIGRFSSFAQVGGNRTGLQLTRNGGDDWTELTDPLLVGENFSAVAVRGNVLLAASNGGSFGPVSPFGGLFRSADGGTTFSEITGTGGLPSGNILDMAGDPSDANRFYVSLAGIGIFRSDDAGLNWINVSVNDMSATGINTNMTNAGVNNAELSVGSNGRLYVGVMINGVVGYLGHTSDQGQTWVRMDLPLTPEAGGVNSGLQPRVKPGGQGGIHFSIVADPSNPDLVYVGGDRQGGDLFSAGGNFVGAMGFTGRLFRGNTTITANGASPSPQWDHLTHSNAVAQVPNGGTASSSAPHADSRDMAFDANGDIIEVSDGGIYRRSSPQDNTGDWVSINGNIQVTEFHDIAYDTISDIIIGGAQDTGTPEQESTGSFQYRSVSTADGGDVAVDAITLAAMGQSIRYSSLQDLGAFRRRVIDTANTVISTVFPTLNVTVGAGLIPQFSTPLELNAVNPAQLIIGGANGTYESFDMADNLAELGTGISVNGSLGEDAISYGGFMAGVPNADVLYVGSGAGVFVRTTGTGAPVASASYPGGLVRDIVLDPDNWMRAFVVDTTSVYETTDAGTSWTNITGNLPSIPRSLEFIPGPNRGVVVGAITGVFITEDTNSGVWNELDAALPTVPVWDLDYDPVDDLLVAGTLGRGAWLFQSASLFAQVNPVTPPPPATVNILALGDTILGDDGRDTILGADGNDTIFGGADRDSITGGLGNDIIFGEEDNDKLDGGSGNDTLDGGSGNDTLTSGAGFDEINWNGFGSGVDVITKSVGSEVLNVTTSLNNNTVTLDEASGNLRVSESTDSIVTSDSTNSTNVFTRDGDDTVNIQSLKTVNLLSILIDTGIGNDTINGTGADVGLLRIQLNGGDGDDAINGTLGRDIINGGDGNDVVSGGSGNDTIDGGNGDDTLNGDAGRDSIDGGIGDDMIFGGDGNDIARGGFGNDFVNGDADNDDVRGGQGDDIVVGSFGNDLVHGDNGDDSLFGGTGNDQLDGGNGADYIRGHSGSDLIKGGDGNDEITGDAGNDVINGGDGNDLITDSRGLNTLAGGDGDDIIIGGNDSDTIIAGDGDDMVFGGGGRDLIFGNDGDDTLRGNSSKDRFNSGEGDDSLGNLGANEVDDESLVIAQSIQLALDALTF